MGKMLCVAAVSLVIGALLAGHGLQARASSPALACPKSSQAAVTHFIQTTLGQGVVASVPAGCTDELLILAYLQIHQLAVANRKVATLQGEADALKSGTPRISLSPLETYARIKNIEFKLGDICRYHKLVASYFQGSPTSTPIIQSVSC